MVAFSVYVEIIFCFVLLKHSCITFETLGFTLKIQGYLPKKETMQMYFGSLLVFFVQSKGEWGFTNKSIGCTFQTT